jgi:VWFA-related protein
LKGSCAAKRGIAALAALTLAVPIAARQPQRPVDVPGGGIDAPSGEPAAPPIRIDAIVTDRQGRPVLDLRASDFELRVNGTAQPLEAVEVHAPPAAGDAAARHARRVFGFLLDEFHVGPGPEAERVRQSMTRFIDEQLRPDDLAVVLKPLDPVSAIAFTSDRDALRQAVATFTGRKGDYTPRSRFEEQFIGRAPATVATARVQIVSVALTELALQLGELNAERSAMVLVSEGFVRGTAVTSRRSPRVLDLQGVLRAASRFHFSVYALNPAAATPAPMADPADPSAATLEWLAAQTGGSSVLDGATLGAGLERVARELDAYYALTLPPGEADGRFHPIELRARRAGVTVRARPGYWAPLSSEVREWLSRSGAARPATPARALRRSTLIEAWAGVVPLPSGTRGLLVSWEPPARSAAGRPVPARVEVVARSGSGSVLFEGTIGRVGSVGTSDAARFEVPAGRIELDMRIIAEDGTLLDSDVRDLTVPDLTRANVSIVIAPQIIRARTMNEFRAAVADPAAVPTAVRSFARSERLLIRVPGWGREGAPVRPGVRLLNRSGHPIRTLDPTREASGPEQFELPLAWLAPGEYYLEFSGRNDRDNVRERVAIRVTG